MISGSDRGTHAFTISGRPFAVRFIGIRAELVDTPLSPTGRYCNSLEQLWRTADADTLLDNYGRFALFFSAAAEVAIRGFGLNTICATEAARVALTDFSLKLVWRAEALETALGQSEEFLRTH